MRILLVVIAPEWDLVNAHLCSVFELQNGNFANCKGMCRFLHGFIYSRKKDFPISFLDRHAF